LRTELLVPREFSAGGREGDDDDDADDMILATVGKNDECWGVALGISAEGRGDGGELRCDVMRMGTTR
jgi:hypothetical protein